MGDFDFNWSASNADRAKLSEPEVYQAFEQAKQALSSAVTVEQLTAETEKHLSPAQWKLLPVQEQELLFAPLISTKSYQQLAAISAGLHDPDAVATLALLVQAGKKDDPQFVAGFTEAVRQQAVRAGAPPDSVVVEAARTKQAYLASVGKPGEVLDALKQFWAFSKNQFAMAGAHITRVLNRHGSDLLAPVNDIHLRNLVADALGMKQTRPTDPKNPKQTQALWEQVDLFNPASLSEAVAKAGSNDPDKVANALKVLDATGAKQTKQLDSIVRGIKAAGGEHPRLRIVPAAIGAGGEHPFYSETARFEVERAGAGLGGALLKAATGQIWPTDVPSVARGGSIAVVDDRGQAFDSWYAMSRAPGLPHDTMMISAHERGYAAGANKPVAMVVENARRETYVQEANRRAHLQEVVAGTALVGAFGGTPAIVGAGLAVYGIAQMASNVRNEIKQNVDLSEPDVLKSHAGDLLLVLSPAARATRATLALSEAGNAGVVGDSAHELYHHWPEMTPEERGTALFHLLSNAATGVSGARSSVAYAKAMHAPQAGPAVLSLPRNSDDTFGGPMQPLAGALAGAYGMPALLRGPHGEWVATDHNLRSLGSSPAPTRVAAEPPGKNDRPGNRPSEPGMEPEAARRIRPRSVTPSGPIPIVRQQGKTPADGGDDSAANDNVKLRPGRYDNTLRMAGNRKHIDHHSYAGVEAAAEALTKSERVAIVVGSQQIVGYTAEGQPISQLSAGGFTGAAELGRELRRAGKEVTYIIQDQGAATGLRKVLADYGEPTNQVIGQKDGSPGRHQIVVYDPGFVRSNDLSETLRTDVLVNDLFSEHGSYKIDTVVAVNVAGRNTAGSYVNSKNQTITAVNQPLDNIVAIANQLENNRVKNGRGPKLTTIAISSTPNHVGMANVADRIDAPSVSDMPVHHLITAWNSSLGGHALAAELRRLGDAAETRPKDWAHESALMSIMDASGVRTVNGHTEELQRAAIKLIESQAFKDPGNTGLRFKNGNYLVLGVMDSSNGGLFAAATLAAKLQKTRNDMRFIIVVDHGAGQYGKLGDKVPGLTNNTLQTLQRIGREDVPQEAQTAAKYMVVAAKGDVDRILMACNSACASKRAVYAEGIYIPVDDLIETTVEQMVAFGGDRPVSVSTELIKDSHAYSQGAKVYAGATVDPETGALIGGPDVVELAAQPWVTIVNNLDHLSAEPDLQRAVMNKVRMVVHGDGSEKYPGVPKDATSVWLTCTHFPALKELVEQALKEKYPDRNIPVVDPMEYQAIKADMGARDTIGDPSPMSPGRIPANIIISSGSAEHEVPKASRMSRRDDAIVYHTNGNFDPNEPIVRDTWGYAHDALSREGSPYDAALVAFNSRSISNLHDNGRIEAAANGIRDANRVLLLTNFNVEAGMPETDGPPGTAALGRALELAGKEVVYCVSDEPARNVLAASLKAFGIEHADIRILEAGTNPGDKSNARLLFNEVAPDAVIAVEVPGQTKEGKSVNMRGKDISSFNTPLHQIVEFANEKKGVVTVGVFDGGNEVGAGNIADRVPLALDGETIMASQTKVDFPVAAWNSNFGADTLAIEVLRQHGLLEHVHTGRQLVSAIEASMQANAVDGVTRGGASEIGKPQPGTKDPSESGVDGFAPWVHSAMHDLQVQRALERGAPEFIQSVGYHEPRKGPEKGSIPPPPK